MEKEIVRNDGGVADGLLHKFRLYETRSNYYLIGRNKSRTCWRVLKIDRLEPLELNICEDPTTYSQRDYHDLLMRIHEGNRPTGGLKFVTNCYGIVGFVRFLGPYYMLLITKRKQIGTICGHAIYAVTKTEMITLPNPTVNSSVVNPKSENRYKKLLCTVDLTKDFFFSYSYHIMRSLQKNLYDGQTGQIAYETMFVWNEFLTRGIRNHLKNTLWTVALVYGFFKQAKLSISGKDFKLTLIARRSRHYAGTRYLKRGVNEKGRVANDVETEQIVFPDVPGECLTEITSVVQNRGSIPLFWSQETSRLNIKPDIVLHKKDQNYEATRIHFENLVRRYGNPIIILNLIKKRERKPRESILRTEFANAIDFINKDLSEENRLRFLHWDLNKLSRSKATNVLALLGKVATYALTLTNFFYCQVTPAAVLASNSQLPVIEKENALGSLYKNDSEQSAQNGEICINLSQDDKLEGRHNGLIKSPMLQKGVLRTNCIDCLDRTNVAQYAYGLAALGHQLHALGLIDTPKIDQDPSLANDLMRFYEKMGDTLALQYGGSAAHNKIFSERRGQWKAATQSQEIFRTLQRYYSNAYMDAEKQDAINVFLGHFQPQQGKPALWELGSDHHCDIGRLSNGFPGEIPRSSFKRSLSDGNILCDSDTIIRSVHVGQNMLIGSALSNRLFGDNNANGVPDLNTETGECSLSFSRQTPMTIRRQIFEDADRIYFSGHEEGSNCSNFPELDWLSSSGNSCDEEIFERSSVINSPIESRSTENVMNAMTSETEASSRGHASGSGSITGSFPSGRALSGNKSGYSDRFVHWVDHGETLCL